MRNKILILEDDPARLRRLLASLAEHPKFEIRVWSDAHAMIADLGKSLPGAALICLDHDLYATDDNAPDPGDGLDVVRYLCEHPPSCPVLIHSSNTARAAMMLGALQLEGWTSHYIQPIGSNWIEADWAIVVADLLTES